MIFYYYMKALDSVKANDFYMEKLPKFQRGGQYFVEANEVVLDAVATSQDTTFIYSSIYEKVIEVDDEGWQKIFGIIKQNKARNIHATIIDFPILKQNLNLLTDKLLDYSDDRHNDMSLMKYMVYDSHDKLNCHEISTTGNVVAVGFEDGVIKIFKRKIRSTRLSRQAPVAYARLEKQGSMGKNLDGTPASFSNTPKGTFSSMTKAQAEEHKEKSENLIGHKGPIFCLSISHDDKLLVSGSFDSTIRLWHLPDGSCIFKYNAHQAAVWDIKFFTYSSFFASGSADGLAKMWTISKGEPVRIFAYHEVDVVKVEFVPKYKSLVTASLDFTMVIWNIIKGQRMIVIESIESPIRSLVVTKSCRYLITGNEYGNLCVFDLNFKCINILNIKHSDGKAIWSIDFDQYYHFLAVGDEDSITVYNFKELCKVATINPTGKE